MIGRAKATPSGPLFTAIFWLACATPLFAQTSPAVSENNAAESSVTVARKAAGPRPSSELLGRSLGLSAGILALGGAILLANRILIRRSPGRPTGQKAENLTDRGEVVQRIRLSGKQMLHVVQFGENMLLIGTGADDAPRLLTQWSALAEAGEVADEISGVNLLTIPRAEEPAA